VVPEERALERDSYDAVLTRVYQAPGAAPIMLLVAYGASQSGNMQLHRPEACYPAAGFELQEARRETLNLAGREVPARVMSAVAPDRTEQVLYWTRIGSEFPLGAMAQRLAVMQENVRGRVPDGVLVRASAIDDQPDRALASLVNFLDTLLASASADARALLVGN
jgi:EpsI family protein